MNNLWKHYLLEITETILQHLLPELRMVKKFLFDVKTKFLPW